MRQSSYGMIFATMSLALFAACGDSESNDANGSGATAGTSAGTSSDGGANDSAGSPGSGGSSMGGESDGSSGDTSSAAGAGNASKAGAGGNAGEGGSGGASCPDLSGDYDLTSASGDCETLNVDATELIEETAKECVMAIVSEEPEPGEKGVSGEVAVALDGSFEEARLFLDDVLRYPCSGTWNEQDETLSIVCEGPGDDCTMVLERQ